MKIKRAVKAAAVEKEVKEVIKIAGRSGIHGIEIQEIIPLIEEIDFKKRGDIILNGIGQYPIKDLVYHYPLKFPFKDFDDMLNIDLSGEKAKHIFDLTQDTIKEAGYVANRLNLNSVLVVVHITGFARPRDINPEKRKQLFEIGESNLRELKKAADYYSKKFGCLITIVRENNPPDHGFADGLTDFNPEDTLRTFNDGIGVNLDLAHLWMYNLYCANGKEEFPGADLSKKIYQNFDIYDTIKKIAPALKMLHLNDAGPGYDKKLEGIEIGTGNIPHKKIIETIINNISSDIIGTYEIANGHIDPETIYRSDLKYREIFGNKFNEYFG